MGKVKLETILAAFLIYVTTVESLPQLFKDNNAITTQRKSAQEGFSNIPAYRHYLRAQRGMGRTGRRLNQGSEEEEILPQSEFALQQEHQQAIKSTTNTYPLTPPEMKFRIGVISDLDQNSLDQSQGKIWISYLKEGNLYVKHNKQDPSKSNVTIEWDNKKSGVHTILSGLSYSLRGMELSTLNVFNGKLFSCDDRTGVIYQLVKNESTNEITPTPWTILANGNFTGTKGFKCEWATIKDGCLLVGGHGIDEVLKNGEINKNAKFVKRISANGAVTHIDWSRNYDRMAQALNVHFPGYVVHESAGWSEIMKKFMFMPRKISATQYEEKADESKGSNIALLADENFENVQVGHVGKLLPTHGFSSFKFIPQTNDKLVVAIKTVELKTTTESFIMAFDFEGNLLLPETKIGDQKFEGIEFI